MEEISQRLQKLYGLEVTSIEPLVGEVNKNYLVRTAETSYIYKESPADPETASFSREETRLLESLSAAFPGKFQRPIPGLDGSTLLDSEDGSYQIRLLEYIQGEHLAEADHSPELVASLGDLLARADQVLMKEYCPVIRSRRYDWDNLHFDLNMHHAPHIIDAADRKLVAYFHLQFHEQVVPRLPGMRYALIHNDANDYNVLVRNGQVAGIIDLGDAVYTLLVNELANALVYILPGKDHPLDWAGYLIKAYSQVLPLTVDEADLLYYLIGTRLSISLLHSAWNRKEHPENEYLLISQAPVLQLLRSWVAVSPLAAADAFRKAAGLPLRQQSDIHKELEKRDRYLGRNLSLSYQEPLKMELSAFQYMFDAQGRRFLDMRNNIPHVGHAHPKVVKAGQEAMARLNTNTRYLYDAIHRYSEKLLAYFPEELNRVFYVNSGSAATDLALRLAQTHTEKQKMLVMEHAYHGNTVAAIGVSHFKFAGKGGSGASPDTLVAPIPLSGLGDEQRRRELNRERIASYLENIRSEAGNIAAFITEPIVSAAGQVVINSIYTRAIRDFIREQGGLFIADEVQTGFGRLGHYFWGYEQAEVIPDIVILGKPIANGHPMAAVVCRREIADSFDNGMEFFSSFGGNPVSCAMAEAVLDVIEEEKLAENAAGVGDYLIRELHHMRTRFPVIGDIRGWGLSLGIELLEAGKPSKPATSLGAWLVEAFKDHGILAGTDGPHHNVLKLKPPLCFSKENADEFLETLSELLDESQGGPESEFRVRG